jgi:hypothetical protein
VLRAHRETTLTRQILADFEEVAVDGAVHKLMRKDSVLVHALSRSGRTLIAIRAVDGAIKEIIARGGNKDTFKVLVFVPDLSLRGHWKSALEANDAAMGEYDEQRILDEYEEDSELFELCIQHTSDEMRAVLQKHKEMEQSFGSCSQPVCFQNHRPVRPVKPPPKPTEEQLIHGRMPATYVRLHARQQVSNWLRKRSSRRKQANLFVEVSAVPNHGPQFKFPQTGTVGPFDKWQRMRHDPEGEKKREREAERLGKLDTREFVGHGLPLTNNQNKRRSARRT